jgi:hypothetical protein
MGKVRGTGGFWALPGPLHYATIVAGKSDTVPLPRST